VAGIVAFAVFAAAAALALGAFNRDRTTSLVATPEPEPVTFTFEAGLRNGGEIPSATMTTPGSTYSGKGSSHT
jgi:hypothetical protein